MIEHATFDLLKRIKYLTKHSCLFVIPICLWLILTLYINNNLHYYPDSNSNDNIDTITISTIIPRIKLHNAANKDSFIPVLGLGCALTYNNAYSSAQKWLQLGGRHFDESYCYATRLDLIKSVLNYTKNYTFIPRSHLFIVSKVGGCCGDNLGYNEVIDWFNKILNTWQTTYIDVILLHWPSYSYDLAINPSENFKQKSHDPSCLPSHYSNYNATKCRLKSWKALIELYLNGSIKAIGVSNFGKKHLNDIINYKYNGKHYLPAMNQIQFHGYKHEYNLLTFCKQYNIQVSSWSPLGAPDIQNFKWVGNTPILIKHPIALNIGKKYNKTPSQVWLRWQLQFDNIP
eukprot:266112_1